MDYERNKDFGRTKVRHTEWNMATPPKIVYRDVHGDTKLPSVSEEMIESYISSALEPDR